MINKYLLPAVVFSILLNLYLVSEYKTAKNEITNRLEMINQSLSAVNLSAAAAKSNIPSLTDSSGKQVISDSTLQQIVKRIVAEEVTSTSIQARVAQAEAPRLREIQEKIDNFDRNMKEIMQSPGSASNKELVLKIKEEILSQCKR